MSLSRPLPLLALLVLCLVALACVRPIDHDESQYVAAAALTARGLLPYRDYAYLQTPLQPLLLAPVAWMAGRWTWPALRLVNALFGALIVGASWRAMRVAGADTRTATGCAALMACCEILLFSAATARNDALPAALYALALVPMLRAERAAATRATAGLAGLLLAAAAATKLSYALPAAAYGLYALARPAHRPQWIALGALPIAVLVAALGAMAPQGFMFGAVTFPTRAPAEYYEATGRLWKLSTGAKLVDTVKFLALGPALLALAAVAARTRPVRPTLLLWLIAAGAAAALLPTPTWRQYLLPLLPPLFVQLALLWQAQSPTRPWRIAALAFAIVGPIAALADFGRAGSIGAAIRQGHAIAQAMDAVGARGPVATLSPQFVPASGRAIDPRFATGPFYFRSRGLLPPAEERPLHLVSIARIGLAFDTAPPGAIVVGGESDWTAGNMSLDAALEGWAIHAGWRAVPVAGHRFRLYVPQGGTVAPGRGSTVRSDRSANGGSA